MLTNPVCHRNENIGTLSAVWIAKKIKKVDFFSNFCLQNADNRYEEGVYLYLMSGVSTYKSLLNPNRPEAKVFDVASRPRPERPESDAQIQPPGDQYQGPSQSNQSRFQDILNGIKSNQSE